MNCNGCPPTMCCPEAGCPNFPFATVTMTVPPPIVLPTQPTPVKPLQLPCPCPSPDTCTKIPEEFDRYDNYYNNYNVDYHCMGSARCCSNLRGKLIDLRKKDRPCENYMIPKKPHVNKGCPTGFKPCLMELRPPSMCDPCGVWCAKVEPCPPKRKKDSCKYAPGRCRRPCCKHWKDPDGPCVYDKPCKAHCFNHPPGIKPKCPY